MDTSLQSVKSSSTKLLVIEALKRGIFVEHMNPKRGRMAFLELNYRGHREFISGQSSSANTYEAMCIADDKVLTKKYLKRAGISVSEGKAFRRGDEGQMHSYAQKIGFPVVLKPCDGAHGRMVKIGIRDSSALRREAEQMFVVKESLLMERMFANGTEYRIMSGRDKVFAVAKRVPANVVGDGTHTIRELIAKKNDGPRKELVKIGALYDIHADEDVVTYLTEQKKTLDTIPPEEAIVYLRKNSNVSTGGDSIDFTDHMHPDIEKIAVGAVNAIPGLSYAGIDFITRKPFSEKPDEASYSVLELNVSVGFDIHHHPYRGKSRNVATRIIDILFPETKDNIMLRTPMTTRGVVFDK